MTVHSKDGKQQTTKLDRIGKLAVDKKEMVFNNLGHVLDLNLLRECYRQQDRKKAVGIDGVTKESYGAKLEENLQNLLGRIRRNAYKPQPSRLVEIPKEDGGSRPLAISCFEDKLVQAAAATILTKVYEPIFLPCSYGYREGVNGHEALRMLMKYNYQTLDGATVEIDLQKYFNSIPHLILNQILQQKIADKRFLNLIETLVQSPIMDNNGVRLNKIGCPQGSIISAILANIYLHYVIDDWFNKIKKKHIKGKCELVRFVDDMVFIFQHKEEAERFYKTLPKRLERFGLKLNEDKSSLIRCGKKAVEEVTRKGERLSTYKFLGFVCYWGQSRTGFWRLKFKSRADRFNAKLKFLRKYLRENLNVGTHIILKKIIRVVRGWINYHAITDNQRRVHSFILESKREIFRWINRKGGKRRMNWENFSNLLKLANFPENFKTLSMFAAC